MNWYKKDRLAQSDQFLKPTRSAKSSTPLPIFQNATGYLSPVDLSTKSTLNVMFSKFSLVVLALSACSVRAATDCFTQVGDPLVKPADDVHRVSIGVNCGNTTGLSTCVLTGGGNVTEAATLNITSDSTPKIFDAVRQQVDQPFNDTLTGRTGVSRIVLYSGQAGYFGFTTLMRCFRGTLGSCIGGDVEAGTPIEACTPTVLNDNFTAEEHGGVEFLHGAIQFVPANASVVANMSTNPADPTSEITTNTTTTDQPDDEHSAAGRQMGLGVGAIAVIVAGTVFGLL